MIDPREIRVGNYVRKITGRDSNEKSFFQYKAVAVDEYYFTFAKACFPIPLTPAILGVCGLIHEFGDWYINREVDATEEGLLLLRYRYQENKWYINEMLIPAQPRHLHQLQNLYYALTGKELSVNLEAFENLDIVGPVNFFIKQPQQRMPIHGLL